MWLKIFNCLFSVSIRNLIWATLLPQLLIDFLMLTFCHWTYSSPSQAPPELLNLLKSTHIILIFLYALCRCVTSRTINSGLIHTLFVGIVLKIFTWWRPALWPNWFCFLSERKRGFFSSHPKVESCYGSLVHSFINSFLLFLYFFKTILNLSVFPSTAWHLHSNLQNRL